MGKPWENHGKTMGKPWENGDLYGKLGHFQVRYFDITRGYPNNMLVGG